MIPIHALLARIRWDPHFGRDRIGLVRVPLDAVRTQAHIGFVFDVVDEEGIARSIPYHRVRQVFQGGKLVWSRLAPKPPERK